LSAPLIWIGLPLFAALILWFLSYRRVLTIWLAILVCLALVVLAWLVPISASADSGSLLQVTEALVILGRRFTLSQGDKAFLMLIFGFSAFWFFGALLTRVHRFFVPLALVIVALLVAAIAVEPFLYAALLVETAVLLSVPMLVPPGTKPGQGVLRYLIFQTLAMPFLLLAGWVSSGVEASPANQQLLQQAVVLLGLGFSFWLAIFPFYTWVPLLMEESNSYTAGFVLTFLPIVFLILMLEFLNAFTWLREYPQLSLVLRSAGTVMVVTGGIWAAFQRNLARLFGYAVIIENGFALLALSLRSQAGLEIYAASFLPRIVVLGIWALALTLLEEKTEADYPHVVGLLHRYPVLGGSILLSSLSLAGFPLLANFPLRQLLFENLAQRSLLVTFWIFVGSAGLLFSSFRMLSAMTRGVQTEWRLEENWRPALLLTLGIVLILLIGIFPNALLPRMLQLLNAFNPIY
jgi:formate hydrogenlyase subunit 3/multisubunit Na+/H+ antiporter MnhD subunit